MITTDIAIVGAGPAGIAAATEAAAAGAGVLVLDEYSQPGGQYYRHPAPGITPESNARVFASGKEGVSRIKQAVGLGAIFLSDTLVWAAFPDGTLAIQSSGRAEVIKPSKLVLACGAHERPVAFPGWTLPGVITAGAAQTLLKSQGILPGHKILMAGTGPLQIAVAAQLVEAGARLVGVLEAGKVGGLFGSGPRFWGQWDRLREGVQYWRTLRSAKVPLMFGRTVVRAEGDISLSSAVTMELADDWSPIPGSESRVETDALCLGFGLVPSTKLARLLSCKLTYDPTRGGYVPVHDDSMQTSVPGVFVAGEAAGIGGAKVAELQGRIAANSILLQLGKGNANQSRSRIESARRELKSELRFAKSMNELFVPRQGIQKLLTDDTIVCRCEEVTVGQLLRDRPAWSVSLDSVRTVTRVGMGNCQGTMCETLVAELLARETGKPIAEVGTYQVRPPLKPVPVGALADLSDRMRGMESEA